MTTPTASADPMLSFRTLTASPSGARTGTILARSQSYPTPTFIATSSRGVVPHLSHDNLRTHTAIPGLYNALEDCTAPSYPPLLILQTLLTPHPLGKVIERGIPTSPVYTIPASPTPSKLRTFTGLPNAQLSILSARRSPPVTTAAANNDHSLAILTSVGFRMLKLTDFIMSACTLGADLIISPPDIPNHVPGKNRIPKMAGRTVKWLETLLDEMAKVEGSGLKAPVLAAVLPVERERQEWYFKTLVERSAELEGLAVFGDGEAVLGRWPEGLEEKLHLMCEGGKGPVDVVKMVAGGVDVVNLGWLNTATDRGVGLDFEFPGKPLEGGNKRKLGIDHWGKEMAVDVSAIMDECECYACRKHHRAYINHLLNAKEMSAWVLLQIHNSHVVSNFFAAIRASIEAGTFEKDAETFESIYESELPVTAGDGPRVRGYMFKNDNGPKRNKKVFNVLKKVADAEEKVVVEAEVGGDMEQALEEATEAKLVEEGKVEGLAEKAEKLKM